MKKYLIVVLALILLLTACSGPFLPTSSSQDIFVPGSDSSLQSGASYADLIKIYMKAQKGHRYSYRNFAAVDGMVKDTLDAPAAESQKSENLKNDYSKTNLQIKGVDEADIIKTDGEYLYLIANNRLYIVDVRDPANMKVLSNTAFSMNEQKGDISRGENPMTMYLDVESQRLILIVAGYVSEQIQVEVPTETVDTEKPTDPESPIVTDVPPVDTEKPTDPESPIVTDVNPDSDESIAPDQPVSGEGLSEGSNGSAAADAQPADGTAIAPEPDKIIPPYYYYNYKQYTTTYVYDLNDKAAPDLVRQFSQTGYYLDSRKIGNNVYVITNEYAYMHRGFYAAEDTDEKEVNPEDVFPSVSGKIGRVELDDFTTIPAGRIAILPEGDVDNQLVISGINMLNDKKEPNLLAVLGTSGTIFCSTDYLYVAAYNYPWPIYAVAEVDVKSDDSTTAPGSRYQEMATDIYRFKLTDGAISAAGQGSVPGSIINQFSMDEYQGYFRIATTTGQAWMPGGENVAKNNLYILDTGMKIVGQVTGLAPGETIKSVRFMGDQAYVVTFRNVDPLFVIDLKNPAGPQVLGQLKIPGYSTYLHPYDENKLLGFGYDVTVKDENAYNGGLKVSLFDIADFNNPRELSTIVLGGRGSHSELLYNHKPLLFSLEKNLIAFPAALYEKTNGVHEYGNPNFQGFLILSVNAASQLELRGSISHFDKMADPNGPAVKLTDREWNAFWSFDMITRGAYIGNTIFTVSASKIRATALDSLNKVGGVELPGFEEMYK